MVMLIVSTLVSILSGFAWYIRFQDEKEIKGAIDARLGDDIRRTFREYLALNIMKHERNKLIRARSKGIAWAGLFVLSVILLFVSIVVSVVAYG